MVRTGEVLKAQGTNSESEDRAFEKSDVLLC